MIFTGRIVLSGIHGQGNPIERFWGLKGNSIVFNLNTSVFRERGKNNAWLFTGFGFFSFADAK